jgi:hypothetical protein
MLLFLRLVVRVYITAPFSIFMEIADFIKRILDDKVHYNTGAHCPPHYLPHKLPVGRPVSDEPCHFHKSGFHMLHHTPFCRKLKCPYVDMMLNARGNHIRNIQAYRK